MKAHDGYKGGSDGKGKGMGKWSNTNLWRPTTGISGELLMLYPCRWLNGSSMVLILAALCIHILTTVRRLASALLPQSLGWSLYSYAGIKNIVQLRRDFHISVLLILLYVHLRISSPVEVSLHVLVLTTASTTQTRSNVHTFVFATNLHLLSKFLPFAILLTCRRGVADSGIIFVI